MKLEKKMKKIKEFIGKDVVFTVGIRSTGEIDILKAEKGEYLPDIPEDFDPEHFSNKTRRKSYIG